MQCGELPQFARLRFERIRLKLASVSNGKLTHRERCLYCSEGVPSDREEDPPAAFCRTEPFANQPMSEPIR